jgi:hypothetical protein
MNLNSSLKNDHAGFATIIGITRIDKLVKFSSQKTLFQVWTVIVGRKRPMTKRRVASVFALPFVVPIWLLGYTLCLAAEKKVTRQIKKI